MFYIITLSVIYVHNGTLKLQQRMEILCILDNIDQGKNIWKYTDTHVDSHESHMWIFYSNRRNVYETSIEVEEEIKFFTVNDDLFFEIYFKRK